MVIFQGKPLTLVGRKIKMGAEAPNFHVVSQDLQEKSLDDFPNKIKVVTSFPSLDTSVCDLQVKEFNHRAAALSDRVIVLAISKDLPFGQKRFCEHFAIKNISVLSDYKTSSFGINYGLLIKELNLLARAVMILDQNNVIHYVQIVEELTHSPNVDGAMDHLKKVLKQPSSVGKTASALHCIPCEGKAAPLPKEKVQKMLSKLHRWQLVEEKKIVKEFVFPDFSEAKYFLDLIALIAEEQGHHPTLALMYGKVKITLWTHAALGLTDNDFIMAELIDSLL
jgi:thiol peroxidase